MKVYMKATSFQRFIAYIIDYFIISFIGGILADITLRFMNFDRVSLNNSYNKIISSILDGVEPSSDVVSTYFRLYFIELGIRAIFFAILIFIYYVIIAKKWKLQTLGRAAMKVKVINHTGDLEPSYAKLILRECVCSFLIYFTFGGIIMLISALVASATGRSLVDMICNTDLVYKDPFETPNSETGFFHENGFGEKEDKFFDKEYEHKNEKDDIINLDKDDINENVDSNDDEYQVF